MYSWFAVLLFLILIKDLRAGLQNIVYPVIAHNIWSPCGFLSISNSSPLLGLGVHDFAGSGVVHVTGGCSALIATILLGPRTGRFYNKKGELLDEPTVFPGHSKSLQVRIEVI